MLYQHPSDKIMRGGSEIEIVEKRYREIKDNPKFTKFSKLPNSAN